EYYSTFELQRGGRDAVIGRVIADHILLLNQMSLLKIPELLAVDHQSPLYNEGSRRSVFYAQAWALTHMILRNDTRVPQLSNYLAALANGQAPMEAVQSAFAGADLGKELDNYIRRQAFTATLYKFADRLATFESEAVPISQADLDAYLADFLVQEGDLDAAAKRLAAASKADPGTARAKVSSAALASAKDDFGAAETLSRSIGEVSDWYLNYRAGIEFVDALEGTRATVTPDDVTAARRYFDRAKSGGHEFANALARMAALEVAAGPVPSAETRAALERARAISPGRHEYGLLLAHALARQSDFAGARAILGPLMSPLNPEHVRSAARSFMATVVTIEAARDRGSPAPTGPAGGTTLGSLGVDPAAPPARLFLRELKPGEQRFEGILEQIECVVGKGVTFRVKTATETTAVTSTDLSSVDFITYRKDLTGSIQCGPVTPALPVYVTWRAGAAAGSKIVVALEFPPK